MNHLILHFLLSYLHRPYIWGGDDPIKGLDCSGFVIEVAKAFGLLANSYDGRAEDLQKLWPVVDNERVGDLVFYGGFAITHVGIVLHPGFMLEAGGGGSRTLTVEDAIKQNAYIRMRPIRTRGDFKCFTRPPWPLEGL